MNKLEYLNQISQETHPVKRPSSTSLSSLILRIVLGAALALALIIVLGVILSGSSAKSSDLTKQLYFRTTSLSSSLDEFNGNLKSSKLRAIGSSLSSTLTSASGQLYSYLTTDDPKAKNISPKSSTLASETDLINSFNLTLTNAKLNGILDRIYLNQIQFQVSLLLSLIQQDIDHSTKDSALLTILQQYYSNLSTIDDSLQSYSNPAS